MLLLIVQGVIETQLSLPSKDTYNWLDLILYLHRYGDLNYDNYTVHGVGFVIFSFAKTLIYLSLIPKSLKFTNIHSYCLNFFTHFHIR